ncbi:MAG: hypothetical protein M1138_06865 [Candidatus Thermoplasmatota archaeon]|nr:hypothetical protein [Candidatus Thermoplasmatota archaeon]
MTKGYKLSPEARKAISMALKADYDGPEGARLREIDSRNGKMARGSTWHRMKKGESRKIVYNEEGDYVVIKRRK